MASSTFSGLSFAEQLRVFSAHFLMRKVKTKTIEIRTQPALKKVTKSRFFTMSGSPAEARIEQLEAIEEDVIGILKNAGSCLSEMSRDRPSQKAVDQLVQQVIGSIRSVDTKLSDQIKYLTQVSTGHPHEGSSYPSQKVLQSAWHRLEHVKTRINELERCSLTPAQKQQAIAQQQQQQQQRQQQQPVQKTPSAAQPPKQQPQPQQPQSQQ